MSPNSVFNGAVKEIRSNSQVQRLYGESLKFYGRDHGGHREGRRNFIEHTQYTSPDDGSKRTRVRFNLEGKFAEAFCFAEVSSEMSSGEFVYVLVQDKHTGRVITVVDNRAALTARRLAGGNQESANAMQQLLGGGKGSPGRTSQQRRSVPLQGRMEQISSSIGYHQSAKTYRGTSNHGIKTCVFVKKETKERTRQKQQWTV